MKLQLLLLAYLRLHLQILLPTHCLQVAQLLLEIPNLVLITRPQIAQIPLRKRAQILLQKLQAAPCLPLLLKHLLL